jgi:CheY-like chemotaxis protein
MTAHVLIANDDAASRHVLRAVLEAAGYSVMEAHNLDATLAQLHASPVPLVVLLDFSYARWNGTAVINAASQDAAIAHRHAYILMLLRDETFPLVLAQAVKQMAVKLLAKPFSTDALLAAVMAAAHRLEVTASATLVMLPLRLGDATPSP